LRDGAIMPTRATSVSVGLDIAICEDVTIPARGHKLAPTGLIMAPPENMWLMLVGRSSLIKRGLILGNAVGIIDPDYCGPDDEIRLSLFNVTDEAVHVVAGSRLAQAIVLPLHIVNTEQMESDTYENSRGGFGSSGV
jgi:dUTP pyrophosphatase